MSLLAAKKGVSPIVPQNKGVNCQVASGQWPVASHISIVANSLAPTGHFREVYFCNEVRGLRQYWRKRGLDNLAGG